MNVIKQLINEIDSLQTWLEQLRYDNTFDINQQEIMLGINELVKYKNIIQQRYQLLIDLDPDIINHPLFYKNFANNNQFLLRFKNSFRFKQLAEPDKFINNTPIKSYNQ